MAFSDGQGITVTGIWNEVARLLEPRLRFRQAFAPTEFARREGWGAAAADVGSAAPTTTCPLIARPAPGTVATSGYRQEMLDPTPTRRTRSTVLGRTWRRWQIRRASHQRSPEAIAQGIVEWATDRIRHHSERNPMCRSPGFLSHSRDPRARLTLVHLPDSDSIPNTVLDSD